MNKWEAWLKEKRFRIRPFAKHQLNSSEQAFLLTSLTWSKFYNYSQRRNTFRTWSYQIKWPNNFDFSGYDFLTRQENDWMGSDLQQTYRYHGEDSLDNKKKALIEYWFGKINLYFSVDTGQCIRLKVSFQETQM